jgi:hypothetical protein
MGFSQGETRKHTRIEDKVRPHSGEEPHCRQSNLFQDASDIRFLTRHSGFVPICNDTVLARREQFHASLLSSARECDLCGDCGRAKSRDDYIDARERLDKRGLGVVVDGYGISSSWESRGRALQPFGVKMICECGIAIARTIRVRTRTDAILPASFAVTSAATM